MSSALILVLGGIGYAGDEDTADTGELPSVEASPPAEAPEEVAVETSPPAEEADTEASDAKESPSVEAAPPAEPAESADPTSSSAVGPDTEDSEATEE